ncbi:MAG: phenylalanine--tRNA ligase subunit beta [Acidimicrobiia bacterium]
MKVSLRWMREYVDVPTEDPVELAEVFSSLGHEVEGFDVVELQFSGVVVGRVEEIFPHPNADKLRLCRVTTGGEPQDIVCGAWNFEAGAIVPVSVPGAVLAGGLTVGVRALRGIESHGMICSAAELGLGDDHSGIMVLDPAIEIGTSFADLVPLPDVVFDLSITPNRPDAMSMLGIARDLGAFYRIPVRFPSVSLVETQPASRVKVTLDDPRGCPRYLGREVRDVTVAPSPLWMQLRLRSAGVRPINNIVDITNYVLLEMGQPLHCFDLDHVAGEEIIVRRAESGETLTTLDGIDRDLSEFDLVIADASGVVAFAGVMGGETTEVGEGTTRVLIEAAHFDPPSVMFTAKRHDLRTEASSRFERGVDPNLPGRAAERAAAFMVQYAGGRAVAGVQDEYPEIIEPWQIELTLKEIPRLLGIELDRGTVIDLLAWIGFETTGEDPLFVTVPTFRPDVRRPADVIEEVARMHGYDKIPETLPVGAGGGLTEEQVTERRLRGVMAGLGYSEAQSWSFVGAEDLENLGMGMDDLRRRAIAVRNPLRDLEPLLRTTLLPGLLKAARFNVSHGADRVALFEIGKVFLAEPSPVDARLPNQPDRLAFVAIGEFGVPQMHGGHPPADVYTATATWRALVEALGVTDATLQQASPSGYHPGRAADVLVGGTMVGSVGELHPAVARAFGLNGRVAAGELALEALVAPQAWWGFREPSTYPPVVFDLAFDLDTHVPSSDLIERVTESAGDWLESVRVFDEFSGASLGEGRKSVAIQLWFRAPDHTLTNEEVGPFRDRIVNRVEGSLDAHLRGGT